MSIETWEKEFYPVEAKEMVDKPLLDIIEHSLVKWIGLTPVNLERHGLDETLDSWRGKLLTASECDKYEHYETIEGEEE